MIIIIMTIIIIIMIIIEQNRKFSLESKLILFLEVLKINTLCTQKVNQYKFLWVVTQKM